eukprot:12924150-Prorocentrum_lima.AAC.1
MEHQRIEVERLQMVEHRLMQEIQDVENKIALEQPRYVDGVANLQVEEASGSNEAPPRYKGGRVSPEGNS